jgi:hypothetical protein
MKRKIVATLLLFVLCMSLLGAEGYATVGALLELGGSDVTDSLLVLPATTDTLCIDTIVAPPNAYNAGYIYTPMNEISTHDAGDMVVVVMKAYLDSIKTTYCIASDSVTHDNQDTGMFIDTLDYVGIANRFTVMIIGICDDADDSLAVGPAYYTVLHTSQVTTGQD